MAGQSARDRLVELERPAGHDITGASQDKGLPGYLEVEARDHPAVGRIDPALIAALQRWMHRDECTAFEDLEFVGQNMDVQDTPAGRVRNAVEIASDADQALMRDAPFELEDGPIRRQRQRLQDRLLLSKSLVDDALCGRVEPRVRDRVEPVPELPV